MRVKKTILNFRLVNAVCIWTRFWLSIVSTMTRGSSRGGRPNRNKKKPAESKPYHEQLEKTLKSTESTLSEKTKGAQKPGASKIQVFNYKKLIIICRYMPTS